LPLVRSREGIIATEASSDLEWNSRADPRSVLATPTAARKPGNAALTLYAQRSVMQESMETRENVRKRERTADCR
jgi:hypothetical protein